MADFATTLSSYFGITGTRATKERGNYLYKSKSETYKIAKSTESFSATWQRYDLLKSLSKAGFSHTDEIIPSLEGPPFIQLGRETYVMSRHVNGQELLLDSAEDMTNAIKTLANFHIKGKNLNLSRIPKSPPLAEVFAKDSAFLTKTAKQVESSTRLSDFDVLFLKNVDKYVHDASNAAQLLAQTNYHKLHTTALKEGHICHNNIKEENLHLTNGTCYIVNWEEASIDLQITDLANFLHRYAMRSQREVPLVKWMDVYSKAIPLPHSGEKIIRAYLQHPWQFIKICKQYFSKKRGWTPIAITSRMDSLLAQQEMYDAYVL